MPLNKNESIKLALEEEERARQKRLKQEARYIDQQERAAKDQEGATAAEEKWQSFRRLREQMRGEQQKGYENWISAMGACFFLGSEMARAVAASDPLGSAFGLVVDIARPGWHVLKDNVIERVWPADVEIPNLRVNIELENDDGLISERSFFSNVLRSDGRSFDDMRAEKKNELFQSFLAGVDTWLKELNDSYELDLDASGNSAHIKFQGQPVSRAKFKELCEDNENGFHKFLSKHFDLNIEPAPQRGP